MTKVTVFTTTTSTTTNASKERVKTKCTKIRRKEQKYGLQTPKGGRVKTNLKL